MPGDTIDRIIFKVEIDGDAYIKGADALANSTNKLAQSQEAANKSLQENEAQLKKQSQEIDKAKKALDSYTGADETRRKQLEKSFQTEKQKFDQINKAVIESKKNFEAAKTAADNFNAASSKALNLQPIPGQGKIPTAAPIVPPVIQAPLKFQDFDLHDVLESSLNEFEQLRIVMGAAREKMASLNAEDAEFKLLAPLVEQGEEALRQYDDAAKDAGQSTLSLRTQIRLGKDELVKLEEAGKGATKEYLELEKKVAKLTDAFGDQQQRIRILASDTKLLDFGKSAITAATSAFQTYTSVQILVGSGSEELQKKTMQLFAAMQLLQSLEQLSNLTRREGQLATLAQAGAQSVYTAVVGSSTGALKALRIALLASGIGAAVLAIGFLVSKFNDYVEAEKEANREAENFNKIQEKAVGAVGEVRSQITKLTVEIQEAKKGYLDKNAVIKEYNESLGKTTGSVKSLQEAEKKLLDQGDDIIQLTFLKAQAQAAGELAAEEAKKNLKAQTDNITEFVSTTEAAGATLRNVFTTIFEGTTAGAEKSAEDLAKTGRKNQQKAIDESKKQFDSFTNLQQKFLQNAIEFAKTHKLKFFETDDTKNVVENVFAQERQRQKEKLAELNRKAVEDEKTIRAQFEQQLKTEQARIDKLLKEKKLTKPQAIELKLEAKNINAVELDKALKDFNKKITDARKKLNDELSDLQQKNVSDQINLLQDEFNRRSQLIEFNEKKEIQDAKDATQDRLDALDLDRLLIGEKAYQDAKADIISIGEQRALNIQRAAAIQRQQLAADLFQSLLSAYDAAIFQSDLVRDKQLLKDLQAQLRLYQAGKISFEQFQKAITKIQKDAQVEREAADLQTKKNELAAIDRELSTIEDKYSDHYKKLKKQRDDIEKDIVDKGKGLVTGTAPPEGRKDALGGFQTDEAAERIATIDFLQDKIQNITNSVISFWQKANEVEQKSLDRSIAIQEKRVSAAQRIAERGNAQYLKAEQDRLTELQVKRENAARKQLGIDAALQASQILVGITGAIAKIATPGIGPAETIAEIAVIVGALATGYGLVKSLQGNQPKLAKGNPYVRRGNNPAGTDTIPAWLNEGEAVIPTDTNKAYHPTVQAIYHKKVPAEDINRFVQNYHRLKPVPQVNHERIKNAAELHIDSSGKMAVAISEQNRLLMENNDLQRATIRAIKSIKNVVSVDKNGFAASFMEVVEQMEIDKNT